MEKKGGQGGEGWSTEEERGKKEVWGRRSLALGGGHDAVRAFLRVKAKGSESRKKEGQKRIVGLRGDSRKGHRKNKQKKAGFESTVF